MNEIIHWQPHPTQRPDDFRARGTPWTTGTHRRKREDYGPLPDLAVLNPPPLKPRKRGRPRLPITDEERYALDRTRTRLSQELKHHPERSEAIKEQFAFLKSLIEGKRRGDNLSLSDHLKAMHETAKALRETNV